MKKPAPFGKYYLLERINVGGMAEVFRAKAFGVEGFERLVAVKRILPNIAEDKEFIRMFIEEAKLAVQLNHANIAQIFDLGVVDGAYYIALEHVHGRDLRGIFDRCRTGGEAMPVAQACFIAMKVCEGLDYAHNKRDQAGREISLVHRDVSPQNVLVSFEGEVKLIDFGIAKAAGKGSKTQAGILKGKFGYMSPEQVRGLPIDRRSDVFSCGIVLYELLTGERLFVGESDFSTLEKVRNVEILPPSTYNRKIPDELERIVLKALAKDTEDRYQNAIDLHDELQAFVYTAGEFYSRKDLAGWMKKTFGKEIEDESAKLESYRQLKPPPQNAEQAPVTPRTITGSSPRGSQQLPVSPPPRRATQGMPAVGTKPPPPPDRRSGQISAKGTSEDSGGLAWDDDELETQIYDNPEDDPKNQGRLTPPPSVSRAASKQLPLVAAPTPAPDQASPPASLTATSRGMPPAPGGNAGPDLSSLVSTAKGWEGPGPSPSATLNGMGATNGASLNGHANGAPALPPVGAQERLFDSQPVALQSQPVARASSAAFDPMASFGAGFKQQRSGDGKRKMMLVAIGGAVVVAVAAVVIIASSGASVKSSPDVTRTDKVTEPVATNPPPAAVGDQFTGFDLYVSPAGITNWKLDGEARTDRLPSRIRGIAPGPHKVSVDPPAGFVGESRDIQVEQGKAPKVTINLEPMVGIKGTFDSNPPGAKVSLIVDGKRQELGIAPQTAPLDPRMTYQVLFEKAGYVSSNKPIQFSGATEEKITAPLEKVGGAAIVAETPKVPDTKLPELAKIPTEPKPVVPKTPKGPVTKIDKTPTEPKEPKVTEPKGEPAVVAAKGTGTLMLGSKPSCDIFIDGKDMGLHTPQREIKLPSGKHKVTLINNEFGIKETFTVDVKPDLVEKAIKDYSDKLPK